MKAINKITKVAYDNVEINEAANCVTFEINGLKQIWMGIDSFFEAALIIEK